QPCDVTYLSRRLGRQGAPSGIRPPLGLAWPGTGGRTPTLVLVATLLVLGTPAAFAGSFPGIGVVCTVGSAVIGDTSTTQACNVTLKVNDTAYGGTGLHPGSDLLDAVAVNVASDANVAKESLLSGPAKWTLTDGGVSGVGCAASGNGFDCAKGGAKGNDLGT